MTAWMVESVRFFCLILKHHTNERIYIAVITMFTIVLFKNYLYRISIVLMQSTCRSFDKKIFCVIDSLLHLLLLLFILIGMPIV